MFLAEIRKNNIYPCKPQFYYIKVGFKGVKNIKVYFRDDEVVTTADSHTKHNNKTTSKTNTIKAPERAATGV